MVRVRAMLRLLFVGTLREVMNVDAFHRREKANKIGLVELRIENCARPIDETEQGAQRSEVEPEPDDEKDFLVENIDR